MANTGTFTGTLKGRGKQKQHLQPQKKSNIFKQVFIIYESMAVYVGVSMPVSEQVAEKDSLEAMADDPESRNFASKAASFARKQLISTVRSTARAYQAYVPISAQLRVYGTAKDVEAAAKWVWHRVPTVYRDRYSIIQGTGWLASKATQVWLLNHTFNGGEKIAIATRGWELAAVWLASAAAFEAVTVGAHFANEFGTTYQGNLGKFIGVRKGLLVAQNIPKALFGTLTWGLNLGLDRTGFVPASTAIHFTGIPFSYEQTRFTTLFKNALDKGESGWHFALSYVKNRPPEFTAQIVKYLSPRVNRLATTTAALMLGIAYKG